MKSLSLLLACLLFSFFCNKANCQSPPYSWITILGGSQIDEFSSIATNPINGEIYASGTFADEVDFDPGPSTAILSVNGVFTVKYDTDGNLIWAKKTGGSNVKKILFDEVEECLFILGTYQGYQDFDPGTGEHYLNAALDGNTFLSKLNRDGELIWVISFEAGFTAFNINHITGEILLTGGFTGTIDADPGDGVFELTSNGIWSDIFISKLDNSGNLIWAKSIGGTYLDGGRSIDIHYPSQDILVSGLFTTTVDFNTDSIDQYLLSGPNQWGYIFILKLDEDGNFKWAKAFGGTGSASSPIMKLDNSEKRKIYIAASFNGNIEVDPDPEKTHPLASSTGSSFILELDSAANFNRVSLLKSEGSITLKSMEINTYLNGGIYVGGDFTSRADFDPGQNTYNLEASVGYDDVFIAKYDLSGTFIWAKSIGGARYEDSKTIATDSSGNLYIGGHFDSPSITFDNTTFENPDHEDFKYSMFIAKIGHSLVSIPWEITSNYINLYPNPATDVLAIEIDSTGSGPDVITLFNNAGIIVHAPVSQTALHQATIDISNIIPGIYFIRIQLGDQFFVKKFVKV